MANPYTPEAARQRYPGQASMNARPAGRVSWRASGASRPSSAQPTNQEQAAPPGPQKAPDMSRYASPGQAQPIQPQSQGTPYGAQPDGNFAYATPQNRPAPFTQRFTNFDGTVSEQPDFGRRDAFIQNINDAMLPYYGGKSQGAPQFDFQNMWSKAGDMVSNGWQNPFAMPARPQQPSLEQQLSQYAPQTLYQPTSMPADPYAQYRVDDSGYMFPGPSPAPPPPTQFPRADDSGYMFPNPAGPQPTGGEWRPTARSPWAPLAFYPDGSNTPDTSYGTRPGMMQRPGAAPSEEVPGMGDRAQPPAVSGSTAGGPPAGPLPSEDEWRVSVGGSWVSPESRNEFFDRGVKAGYTYGPPTREYFQADMNRLMGRMKQ